MDLNKLKVRLNDISEVNPALTCYLREEPAPVLPLREEPDLLSWLENSGRLVTENEGDSQEISTIEEEELSALMGEKEDYKMEDILQTMIGKIKSLNSNHLQYLVSFFVLVTSYIFENYILIFVYSLFFYIIINH